MPDTPITEALREEQIAAGTVMITAAELAPRLGLGCGRKALAKIRARVRIGRLPAYRPNKRTYLFHWPTVVEAIKGKVRR